MTDTITTADTTTAGVAAPPSIADAFAIAGRIQALTAGKEHPGSADIAPETVEDTPDALNTTAASERSSRVGEAMGDFSTIRVSYPPQNLLVAALDEARKGALSIRERRVATGKRIAMPVLRTIAEMGVGKTWAAEKLVEKCSPTDPDDLSRPVLVVELDTSGKQTSLPSGILRELGKRGWNHGSDPEVLWMRAVDAMREFDVQIVIFDEMNRAARRPSIGPVIGGDLMRLLTAGDAAVAFLGTMEANRVFDRTPALKDRMKAPVIMKALDWLLDDEKEVFTKFLRRMDEAMQDQGLVTALAGLDDEAVAKPLWDVCRGRLRPLCLLLEEAVTSLHREDDDQRVLTQQVLAQAVEDLSIPAGVVTYNPFTEEMPA